MDFIKPCFCAAFFCVVLSSTASSQSLPDADAVHQRIIQHQEERQRVRQERLEQHKTEPPSGLKVQEEEPEAKAEDSLQCVSVKTIEVTGVTLLSARTIEGLTQKYSGRCLTLGDINSLLKLITNAYIDRGFVTSRAYLPEQDASNGVLKIQVIEGKIEDIRLNDGKGMKQNELRTAFIGLKGGPLNLRDLEQGLDQLNRLQSNNATMKLVPGSEPGLSVVAISNDPAKRWRASVGWDDSGQESTGKNQYLLQFDKDNFIGLSDMLSVSYSATPLPWEDDDHPKDSQSLSAYWSLPVGYWTLSLSASKFNYSTPLFGTTDVFKSEGDTRWQSVSVERVVHRDAESKTSLGVSVEHRQVESRVAGAKLHASSYEATDVGLKATHARRLFGGSLSFGVEYHQGADFLGSSEALDGEGVPEPHYEKWEGSLSYYRPFILCERDLMWSSILRAQYSPDTLYNAERISIGSRYTVRGFAEDSLSGDTGGYVRNELSWRVPLPQEVIPKVQALEAFAGYDYGLIRKDEDDPFERGDVQGIALGLRTVGDLQVSITCAKPLSAPSFLEKEDFEIYSAVTVSF